MPRHSRWQLVRLSAVLPGGVSRQRPTGGPGQRHRLPPGSQFKSINLSPVQSEKRQQTEVLPTDKQATPRSGGRWAWPGVEAGRYFLMNAKVVMQQLPAKRIYRVLEEAHFKVCSCKGWILRIAVFEDVLTTRLAGTCLWQGKTLVQQGQ